MLTPVFGDYEMDHISAEAHESQEWLDIDAPAIQDTWSRIIHLEMMVMNT